MPEQVANHVALPELVPDLNPTGSDGDSVVVVSGQLMLTG
jgi:hypothetical protein